MINSQKKTTKWISSSSSARLFANGIFSGLKTQHHQTHCPSSYPTNKITPNYTDGAHRFSFVCILFEKYVFFDLMCLEKMDQRKYERYEHKQRVNGQLETYQLYLQQTCCKNSC